jgi:sporulation protein YlmC with PRC-barrel domain
VTAPVVLDLGLHLLDRQVVEVHEQPVCNVDDVELDVVDGVLQVTALLTGLGALGPRYGGTLGRVVTGIHRRATLSDRADPPPLRIPWELVDHVGSDVRLVVPLSELHVTPLEDWVRDHLLRYIPGAGDANA